MVKYIGNFKKYGIFMENLKLILEIVKNLGGENYANLKYFGNFV